MQFVKLSKQSKSTLSSEEDLMEVNCNIIYPKQYNQYMINVVQTS